MSCRHRVIVMSAIVISVLLIPDSHCELVCDSSAVAPFLSQAAFCWRSRGAELPDVSSTRLCCGIAGTHKWLKLIPEGWHTLLVYTLNKMVSLCGHAHTHASMRTRRPVKSKTKHHSVFYRPGALPAAQTTASKHWRQKMLSPMHGKHVQFTFYKELYNN